MNHYKVLGLEPGASVAEVKTAYRKLVMIYHPDVNRNPDAQQKFILIYQAYEAILSGDSTTEK